MKRILLAALVALLPIRADALSIITTQWFNTSEWALQVIEYSYDDPTTTDWLIGMNVAVVFENELRHVFWSFPITIPDPPAYWESAEVSDSYEGLRVTLRAPGWLAQFGGDALGEYPVPEPSAALVMLVGLLMLRRRAAYEVR